MAAETQSLAQLNSINTKVTTRTTSWLDMAMRAWGGEFHAPDHNTYRFSNGRSFDSTDMGRTGIYGVDVPASFEADTNWYDADGTLQISDGDDLLFFDAIYAGLATPTNTFSTLLTETGNQLTTEDGYRILL